MKTIVANKLARVENKDDEMLSQGIVAFQMVEFVISFFGSEIIINLDTKIMEDGRQIVIGGDGYIPDGYEVA
nr:hypothetical protein [uncultured Halomonas sp.]